MANPFFVGKPAPAPYFIGRKRELSNAFDLIAKRSHLAIYGSPGMGKSSLLGLLATAQAWQAHRHDPAQAVIVRLNCDGLAPFTASAFWREVLSLIKDKEPGLQPPIDGMLQQTLIEKADLRRVLRLIGQQDKYLVLLLDDYDAALRPNDKYTEADMLNFLSEFRNLAVHTDESQYLTCVVSTHRRLNELGPKLQPSGSPWYNHYLFLALKPFVTEDVTGLIGRLTQPQPPHTALCGGLVEMAGCWPALLQHAGYRLYPLLTDNQAVEIKQFTRDFESDTRHYYRDAWAFATPVEQLLLMLIALSRLDGRLNREQRYKLRDLDLIFSQRQRELRDLEERGLLVLTENERYEFASSVMEWWVIREIENQQDENELKQREALFLSLLSRQQAEEIGSVVKQVWQQRETVEEVFKWVGKLAGAFPTGIIKGLLND